MTVNDTMRPSLLSAPSTTRLRPRYEGSNVGTWIGFKHLNYLVEEAVLEHFRQRGHQPGDLYERHGLCVDIVELDTRIGHALKMDDLATAEVTPVPQATGELAFEVGITVPGAGAHVRAVSSKVRVLLREDAAGFPVDTTDRPLAGYTVPAVRRGEPMSLPAPQPAAWSPTVGRGSVAPDPVLTALTADTNAVGWRWRIPYFYCHFSKRIQMSGYLRNLEESVDVFLAERGASIKTLLEERSWIPAVPHSVISITDEAYLEEDLYTVLTVETVFKNLTFTARMDAYVLRDGRLLRTATGRITHGYAVILNRADWALVNLDERLLNALDGRA